MPSLATDPKLQHPKGARKGPERLANALLYLPAIALFLWVQCVQAFNGYYGQDSHAYLAYSRKIGDFLSGGAWPGDFFWPVNYPLAGALLSMIPTIGKWSLPLISLGAFLGLLWLFRRALIQSLAADAVSASLFTFFGLGLSPVLLRAANLAMADMLAMFLTFAAWHLAHRYSATANKWCLLGTSALAGLAIGTRYPMALLLVVPGLLTLRGIVRHRHLPLLLPCIAMLVVGLVPTSLWTGAFAGISDYAASHRFSPLHWFQNEFPNHIDGHLRYPNINLATIAEILYRPDYIWPVLPAILFLGPGDFKRPETKTSPMAAVIYLLFVAGVDMQNPRFLIPALPFLIFPLYPAWRRIFITITKPAFRVIFLIALTALSIAVFLRLMAPMQRQQALESRIAADISQLPQRTLYTFAMDGALATYGLNHPIVNLWRAPVETFHPGEYVLFNPTRFGDQWRDRLPMTNWDRLERSHPLKLLKDYGNGWQLYEIGQVKTTRE